MRAHPNLLLVQKGLQKGSFGITPDELEGDELAEYVRLNVLAATEELHEAMRCISWKPWATEGRGEWRKDLKKRDEMGDGALVDAKDQFVEELVDVLHFVFNLFNVVKGTTWDEVVSRYLEKASENARRQKEGYRG